MDADAALAAGANAQGYPARPVRLVAHSMGGLVVRAMAHAEPALWDAVFPLAAPRAWQPDTLFRVTPEDDSAGTW